MSTPVYDLVLTNKTTGGTIEIKNITLEVFQASPEWAARGTAREWKPTGGMKILIEGSVGREEEPVPVVVVEKSDGQ